MLRRLGKSLCRESAGSWIDERELFARIRDTRPGYMRPSLRTSTHSCSWLSVICSRRRDGYDIDDTLTLSYSFRHRNNSSSLDTYNHKKNTQDLVHDKMMGVYFLKLVRYGSRTMLKIISVQFLRKEKEKRKSAFKHKNNLIFLGKNILTKLLNYLV